MIDKIKLLKDVILKYYEENDITKYIYGNMNFIYSDYSEEELEILYKMGFFIKEENIKNNIFNNLDDFRLYDLLELDVNIEKRINRGKIFANDVIYKCFLYFYNNVDSFKKYKTRKILFKDFLEKDYIGTDTSIKYIGILIEYIKDLDEIFSTPFIDLLDILFKFNDECIKEYSNNSISDEHDEYDNMNYKTIKIDGNLDDIHSEIELIFLAIFYNTDKIKGYTYHENDSFLDSVYMEKSKDNEKQKIGMSHIDYNNLFN